VANKNIKQIVYFLGIIWILTLILWILQISSTGLSFDFALLINVSQLILLPIVMIGLWKSMKFGLILGLLMSGIYIIVSLINFNLIGLIIWIIVIYYLWKTKEQFE
jgi:hypothetical protein